MAGAAGFGPTRAVLETARLPLSYAPTRTAAVINEMLRGFPGFLSRL